MTECTEEIQESRFLDFAQDIYLRPVFTVGPRILSQKPRSKCQKLKQRTLQKSEVNKGFSVLRVR